MGSGSLSDRLLPLAFWGGSAVVLLAFFVGYLVIQARPDGTLARIGSYAGSVAFAGVLLAVVASGAVMAVRPGTFVAAKPGTVSDALVTDGVVRLRGTAGAAGWTVEAPFSGEECLAYRWTAEAEELTTRPHELVDTQWNPKAVGARTVPFTLARGDGDAFVAAHLDGLDLRLVESETVVVDDASERPPRVQQFCEEREVDIDGRQRFRESRLEVGEEVLVTGQVGDPSAFQATSDLRLPAGTDAVVTPPETGGLLARLNPFRVWSPFLVSNAVGDERPMRGDSGLETYREVVETELGYETRLRRRVASERGVRGLGVLLVGAAVAVAFFWLGWPL